MLLRTPVIDPTLTMNFIEFSREFSKLFTRMSTQPYNNFFCANLSNNAKQKAMKF